jgi:hypothetical protein
MSREIVTLAAAALAMTFAAPLCFAAGASNAAAQSRPGYGIQVAKNSTTGSSADTAGQPAHNHRRRSHRRHHYSSPHHRSRHHTRTAAEDPKPAAPQAMPTKGVIPRISP